jgi:hypothetical protein
MRRLGAALIACERRDLAQQLLFHFHDAYEGHIDTVGDVHFEQEDE